MKEGDIVRACLDYLKLKKILAWRNQTGALVLGAGRDRRFMRQGMKGSADIIACVKVGPLLNTELNCVRLGQMWAIECKTDKGKQSPAQKEFEALVVASGGRYVVVRSVAELASAIEVDRAA